ncbi:hypothetical protein [Methanocaldococcus sp.]
MEKIKTLYGTIKTKSPCHNAQKKKPTYVKNVEVPVIQFFILEKQLLNEFKKWNVPTPKELFSGVNKLMYPMGRIIPISSAYPKEREDNFTEDVGISSFKRKIGVEGTFQFKIPININAPVEELGRLIGAIKSLSHVGIGGDRTFGCGKCQITLNSLSKYPLQKIGVFAEVWDDELFDPSPSFFGNLMLREWAKYSHKYGWRGVDEWKDLSVRYNYWAEKVRLPEVEVRTIVEYSLKEELLEKYEKIHIFEPIHWRIRNECRNYCKKYGLPYVRYFGGRFYIGEEYIAYESMAKFKHDEIVIEGREEDVERILEIVSLSLEKYGNIENIKKYEKVDYFKQWAD